MKNQPLPVLYSFRRCPYAMRARMAISVSEQFCQLREVVLRDKPEKMLKASPKATVPVLVESNGNVIDESIDIMHWALNHNDPEDWLAPQTASLTEMNALIAEFDGPFKTHLDRYKYSSRYAENGNDAEKITLENREAALIYLKKIEPQLEIAPFLFGSRISLADAAIAPFVRQFANTDSDWFSAQKLPFVQHWLNAFVTAPRFLSIMEKYPQWKEPAPGVIFPALTES